MFSVLGNVWCGLIASILCFFPESAIWVCSWETSDGIRMSANEFEKMQISIHK